MYSSFPIKSDVNVSLVGSGVAFDLMTPTCSVPTKCREFLEKLGWSMSTNHPDTGETLFQKTAPPGATDDERANWNHDLQYSYWHWYEAIAYEFSKFMGIDEDTGASGQDEQPVGSSPR